MIRAPGTTEFWGRRRAQRHTRRLETAVDTVLDLAGIRRRDVPPDGDTCHALESRRDRNPGVPGGELRDRRAGCCRRLCRLFRARELTTVAAALD